MAFDASLIHLIYIPSAPDLLTNCPKSNANELALLFENCNALPKELLFAQKYNALL